MEKLNIKRHEWAFNHISCAATLSVLHYANRGHNRYENEIITLNFEGCKRRLN